MYFDLDTTRPDHLHCYGYGRDTCPNIDRLAKEGVRFTNHFCSDAPCVPSRGATFTGQFGIKTAIVTHGDTVQRIPHPETLLQHVLAVNGLPGTSISTFSGQADWFHKGWETYIRPAVGTHLQRVLAKDINRYAIPWIEHHWDEDFFLFVHYWDPHTPYNMPVDYGERFHDCKPLDYPDAETIEKDQALDAPFAAPKRPIATPEDFQRWISRYDGEIYYADMHIGQILDKMEEVGILDETLIIVTSDHGEQQGHQGVYGDHVSAYDGVIRIPLIMRYPDHLPTGQVIEDFTYGLDVGPTIMELMGIEKPTMYDGASLLPLVRGEAEGRDYVVCGHGLWTAQRAIRTKRWKLVKTLHPGFWPYKETELYEINSDPNETTDLAWEQPEIVKELELKLSKWVQASIPGGPDPLQTVAGEGPPGFRSRLRKLQGTQSLKPKPSSAGN